MKAWVIVLIVLVVVGLIGTIGFVVYRVRKNKMSGGLEEAQLLRQSA